MSDYLCILGREPELSVAELEAVFGAEQVAVLTSEAARVRRPDLKPEALSRLGGTQKIVTVAETVSAPAGPVAAVTSWLDVNRLQSLLPVDGRDVGLSLYGGSNAEQERLRRYLLQLKKEMRQAGRAIRVVTSKERHLSTVTIQRQGLLQHGREIVVVAQPGEVVIGTTAAIQDYQAYSIRDYGRPAADPRRGMIPPKLAQMLLNIAGLKAGDVLLDPFCGVGTILQEAALLGASKIYGADVDVEAIRAAKENIRWLVKEYPRLQTDIEITRADARQSTTRPTVIVTEPDLGRPLSSRVSLPVVEKEARRLEQLYLQAFENWSKTLERGARVVMIWPVFVGEEQAIALDLDAPVADRGFLLQPLLSESAAAQLHAPNRQVLEYGRDDARVRRQIRLWVRR